MRKYNCFIILAISVFINNGILAQRLVGDDPNYKPKNYFGLSGGVNFSMFTGTDANLTSFMNAVYSPDYTIAKPFTSGYDAMPIFGLTGIFEIDRRFSIQVDGRFQQIGTVYYGGILDPYYLDYYSVRWQMAMNNITANVFGRFTQPVWKDYIAVYALAGPYISYVASATNSEFYNNKLADTYSLPMGTPGFSRIDFGGSAGLGLKLKTGENQYLHLESRYTRGFKAIYELQNTSNFSFYQYNNIFSVILTYAFCLNCD